MSKNMTRKGLAIGAGVALIGSALVAAPAQANITGFITLEPTSGYKSAYAVIAGADKTFSLTATQGATAIHSNRELKFLVTDPEAKFAPTIDSAGVALTNKIDDNDALTLVAATDSITVTNADLATELGTGGYIFLDDDLIGQKTDNSGPVKIADDDTVFYATVSGNDVTFKSNVDITAGMVTDLVKVDDTTSNTVTQLSNKRAANNSFVVDTGVSNGTAQVLKLSAPDAVTRTVTVQAWVDFIENDEIDSLDYISPARELTFVAKDDLTGTASLTLPNIGDTSLTATLSTSPVLNGTQVNDANLLAAVFTRQDSAQKPIVTFNTTSQSTVTGNYTATVSLGDVTDLTGWVDKTTAIAAISLTSPTRNDWGFILPDGRAGVDGGSATAALDEIAIATTGVVTVTTYANHNLRSGDKITMVIDSEDDTITTAGETSARTVTVTGAKTFTYTQSETTKPTAASSDTSLEEQTAYSISNAQIDEVFPGDYSARLMVNVGSNLYDALSTASTFGTQAVLADDVEFSTVASASVQGAKVTSNSNTDTDSLVKAGTLSVTVTATVVDDEDAAVGAGRSVAWSFAVGANTTIKVNGVAAGVATTPLTTDANGQVTFTVTDTTGADGKKVTITATPEGVSAAASDFTLEWDTAAVQMYDLNVANSGALATGDRYIPAGGSYDVAVFVADQWFTPVADADYRLAVTGSGVTEGFVNLASGKATVKVTDAKVATSFASTITVQKKGTTGVFASTTTSATITNKTTALGKLTLGANATSLYGGVTVDTADLVAEVALLERDTRVAFAAQPLYVNDVVLAGKATFSNTGASIGKSVVTVSGPTNVLFSNGAVDKRGSITIVSDESGEFAVTLYSTTTQTDTVITVTANGVSSTVKVTFTGIGVGEGTKLDVTTPAVVDPASTYQVKAKLSDVYGNGVEATAGRIKVTYTGPGIVFGTLPDKTDKNGELSFSVLLGSADKGSITVLVSYDQNGDADFVDAKDLNTTKTITVGSTVEVAAKIGSFNGRVAVRVENAKGSTISVKIGRSWYKYSALNNNYLQSWKSRKGASVAVSVYVDGELQNVQTITVK
jgi:hypothetical protein